MSLAIRVPSMTRLIRRFRDTDTVGAVAAFVSSAAGVNMNQLCLATTYPKRQLTDATATLAAAGVKDMEALSVEPRAAGL